MPDIIMTSSYCRQYSNVLQILLPHKFDRIVCGQVIFCLELVRKFTNIVGKFNLKVLKNSRLEVKLMLTNINL